MLQSLLLLLILLAPPAALSEERSKPVILILGDSLSAGYGLDAQAGWVQLLKQKLGDSGLDYQVVNASVSGETTRGGLSRLPALLERHRPQWVWIQLGANDGLRALPLPAMRENLEQMARQAHAAGARAVLFQMHIPSNYGPDYAQGFAESFSDVANALEVPLVPFLLGPFAFDPDLFQADGIHPAAEAQPLMLEVVWNAVGPLLAGQDS